MRAISDLMLPLTSRTDSSVRPVRKTAEDPPRVSVLDVSGVVTGHTHRMLTNAPDLDTELP